MHVVFESPPALPALETFCRGLASEYPETQRINSMSMALNASAAASTLNTSTSVLGFRLGNVAGDRVVQVRRNGISFSHLAPYSEWGTFAAEAGPLFSRYVSEFSVKEVSRLAVRFINRIPVKEGCDIDDYVNVGPRLPSTCPDVEGYFMQLVLPQADMGSEWKAIINTGLENVGSDGSMVILLDIDVFCQKRMYFTEDSVWGVFNQLRERKNSIFEDAITDQVRSMIE